MPLDPDLEFVVEAKLCDLLHKLPSEIEAEDEVKIHQLITYYAAKGQYEREQGEQQRMNAEMQGGPS